jgi:hydrogenase nickel incorporation protein HypB
MCATCGCGQAPLIKLPDPENENIPSMGTIHPITHSLVHNPVDADDNSAHSNETEQGRVVTLEKEILAKNNRIAEGNRNRFHKDNILALNLVSSPGSGKTTILERTIQELDSRIPILVIEGDQETTRDVERIRSTGCPAVQINTGTGCHLEADMVARGLDELQPLANSLVMIENVGNLVCPALFDLGERSKVVILSVTEGDDKPIKYPHMFRASSIMLLNKIDLLPHVQFDMEQCIRYARQVNPDIQVFPVSAVKEGGLESWIHWLQEQIPFPSS